MKSARALVIFSSGSRRGFLPQAAGRVPVPMTDAGDGLRLGKNPLLCSLFYLNTPHLATKSNMSMYCFLSSFVTRRWWFEQAEVSTNQQSARTPCLAPNSVLVMV